MGRWGGDDVCIRFARNVREQFITVYRLFATSTQIAIVLSIWWWFQAMDFVVDDMTTKTTTYGIDFDSEYVVLMIRTVNPHTLYVLASERYGLGLRMKGDGVDKFMESKIVLDKKKLGVWVCVEGGNWIQILPISVTN